MLTLKYFSKFIPMCVLFICFLPTLSRSKNILSLDQIIERVRIANRHLIQTGLAVESGKYNLQNAQSAFDWSVRPVANVGISGSQEDTSQASGIAGSISKKNELGIEASFSPSIAYVQNDGISAGVGVSLSVPLFGGFGKEITYDKIYSADFALQSRKRAFYLVEVEKVLETVDLVYEILRQQVLVKMFSKQETNMKMHVSTVLVKEQTGLGNQLDTYRAQIHLKDVQEQLNVAKQQYQAGLDRLKMVLAMPLESTIEITAPMSYTVTKISVKEAEEIALKNRVEMKQVEADYVEAKRKARVAEKRINPNVKFVASYRKNTFLEGLDASESYFGDYWSIGLTSDTDISRNKEKSVFKQSLLNIRRMQLKKQDQHESIVADVRAKLLALKQDEHRIQIRKEQIIQAKGKRRLTEIKFSHGMGGNFDFIEAETELQRAQVNLIHRKTNYITGQYRLRAALGTLISK